MSLLVSPLRFKIVEIFAMELQTGDRCTSTCLFIFCCSRIEGRDTFVALYWITTLALVTTEVKINRNGYGVHPLGSIEVAMDAWTHVFNLQLPNMKYLNSITTAGFTCGGQPNTPNTTTCSNDSTLFSSVTLLHHRF